MDKRLIVLNGPTALDLYSIARQLQQAIREQPLAEWSIVAGTAGSTKQIGLTLNLIPGATRHPQGYQLTISATGISIVAATLAGIFYGGQTLIQILRPSRDHLPLLRISDWPDFPQRGVMLDISRNKVPIMATLFHLIDRLASWKINQLQLYTEHTFAYRGHPDVWAKASPLTGEEIMALDSYCRERFIELVPNQNTFGHMRRWLIHDRYRPLAECPQGCDTGDPEWGYFDEPFTLCPTDPGSLALVCSLLDELLPHFSSRQVNVGCDETVDLGCGRSRALVAEQGKGRVYLDFLLNIYHQVKARGRSMQAWGDIIMTYPDLVPELPPDLIALEWGYEADHPFAEHGARFAASGIPFYVCPGTSSWNSIAGRTDNALANLRNAAKNGLKHGAVGYLITDWGDNGHWQPLPVSYLPLAYGAALAWGYETNRDLDEAQAAGCSAFDDPSGLWGRVAYGLGNAYLHAGQVLPNKSLLFCLLQETPQEIQARTDLTLENLQQTLAYLEDVALGLEDVSSSDSLLRQEFAWVAAMLGHACRRGLWVLDQSRGRADLTRQLVRAAEDLQTEHRQIWLARNREGGLADSQARLAKMAEAYR